MNYAKIKQICDEIKENVNFKIANQIKDLQETQKNYALQKDLSQALILIEDIQNKNKEYDEKHL